MSCVFGFISFTVFEPMSVLPYWARTLRLYKIFKAQQYYFEKKTKPSEDPQFRWIKEQKMIRTSALLIGILLAGSLVIVIMYLAVGGDVNNSLAKIMLYLPSYSIYACFMEKGQCDGGNYSEASKSHINSALIWLIVINFFGNLFFLTCIYKLRNIKKEFNIRKELVITFISWFVSTQMTLGFVIYHPSNILDWLYLVLVGRSLLSVLLSGTRPLYQTIFKQEGANRFLLLPPNQESVEALDTVLQIPIASDYFFDYLRDIGSREDKHSVYIFALYADLKKFDKAIS
jgi:hypothetical protein